MLAGGNGAWLVGWFLHLEAQQCHRIRLLSASPIHCSTRLGSGTRHTQVHDSICLRPPAQERTQAFRL